MKTQIWLCKVILAPGRVMQMTMASLQSYYARVASGELACLEDNCIVEAVDEFASEELAHDARARRVIDEPSTDWRVVVVHTLDNGERV